MITAQMVKTLRERTGSGMMECKKALEKSAGDIEKAVEILRTSGSAKADKKATRVAAHGRVNIVNQANQYVLVEVNCETDFVAKSEEFIALVNQVADCILKSKAQDVKSLLENNPSLEEIRKKTIAKLGENISIRRFKVLQKTDTVATYLHDHLIGSMIHLKTDHNADEIAKDLAMHIAAFNPMAIDEAGLSSDWIAKEKTILKNQALDSGKPAEIIEKMIVGKLQKFINENTLLGQKFVKDQDISVANYLKKQNAQVIDFVCFKVGEGIEKQQEDFATQVMSQIK